MKMRSAYSWIQNSSQYALFALPQSQPWETLHCDNKSKPPKKRRTTKRHSQTIPRSRSHWTPRKMEDIRTSITRILVARNVHLRQELRRWMRYLPSHKSQTKNPSTPTAKPNPYRCLGNNHNGFHNRPPYLPGL